MNLPATVPNDTPPARGALHVDETQLKGPDEVARSSIEETLNAYRGGGETVLRRTTLGCSVERARITIAAYLVWLTER